MSDILARICADKRDHVQQRIKAAPLTDIEARAQAASPPRGFAERLRKRVSDGGYGLIAEIKRASPSKGLIREDFDPADLARAYMRGGATCLSVLTDKPYFQGDDAYVEQARGATDLPVLRKDFMLDPYQIIESRALGADCILLIMAALDDAQAAELEDTAIDWKMDVLVEVHNPQEIERALQLKSPLIGVNNRNLKTLQIDIAITEQLAPLIPADRTIVCESGLYTPEDLSRMEQAGAHCFLIGESLMRQDDVEAATAHILSPAPLKTGE